MNKFHQSTNKNLVNYSKPRMKTSRKIFSIVTIVLTLGIVLTILNIYELHKMKEDHTGHQNQPMFEARAATYDSQHHPIVWVEGKNLHTGYLNHVFKVFDRIGYVQGDANSNWDVLWSHEYPFEVFSKKISVLKPHQKVNHFPASGFITNKVSLATSSNKYIPTAFKMPSEKEKFLRYAKRNPETLWVQKRNSHRGIRIKKLKELDFDDEGSFVQMYVDKPYLIDKRKFDIGVYAILTSVNPLRVYILENDALFRFCAHDYHPFNPTDVNKYVVGDDYTPMWEMPSLQRFYTDLEFNFKESFNLHLDSEGHDSGKLWDDIKASIMDVYLQKEKYLIRGTSKYKSSRNFFELVRFDFVIDDKMNVYLMEVNMSPNLSSGHFKANSRLYEQVIFNLFSLVGITRPVINEYHNSPEDEADMRVSDKDITVFSDWCATELCLDGCKAEKCQLCNQCYSEAVKQTLKLAYLEHVNRGLCKRIFPPPLTQRQAFYWTPSEAVKEYTDLNKKNKLIYMWFVGKCRQNSFWCQ